MFPSRHFPPAHFPFAHFPRLLELLLRGRGRVWPKMIGRSNMSNPSAIKGASHMGSMRGCSTISQGGAKGFSPIATTMRGVSTLTSRTEA